MLLSKSVITDIVHLEGLIMNIRFSACSLPKDRFSNCLRQIYRLITSVKGLSRAAVPIHSPVQEVAVRDLSSIVCVVV
jgi:hypothetical protein